MNREITKAQVRNEFYKDFGFALWLERRGRRQKLVKAAQRSNLPQGLIDRMERGCCRDLYKFFRLCAYYQKKIKITLVERKLKNKALFAEGFNI